MRIAIPRVSTLATVGLGLFVAISVNYAAPPGDPLDVAEVQVNTTFLNGQSSAAVARDADGDYVVAWSGPGTGDTSGVFFRRYHRNGTALDASERLVNTFTTGLQRLPGVGMDAAGNFVVTWESAGQDGDGSGIYARRYAANGNALDASEFLVNTYTTSDQTQPAVGVAAGGEFVIAWRSLVQDGSGQGVYAQRFSAAGVAAGAEFRVNSFTTNSQSAPTVAVEANGDFSIAWESNGQEGLGLGLGVYLQRYAATGVTLGAETLVNTTTAGNQSQPSLAVAADGALVVSWQGPDASGLGIFMQRYDGSGVAVGSETAVNATTAGEQTDAAVAVDASGDFTVAWTGTDADVAGVIAQRFDATGVAQGGEIAVNGTTIDFQRKPAIALDADGDIVIAWESNLQDTSSTGVYARRFAGPQEVDLKLTQVDDADPKLIGAAVTYTVTVTNTQSASTATGVAALDAASGSATGVVITNTIPTGTTFNSATGSGWTCANVAGTVTCTYNNALLAATSSSVTLNLTAPLAAGEISNAASVVANQYDATAANNSASEPTAVCNVPANAGTVAFSAATFAQGEAGPTATITLTRSGGSCGAVTVNYATADGTAKDGVPGTETQDYTATSGSRVWANGDTADKTFTIALTDDALDEAAETVNLSLALPAGSERGALGAQSTAVLTINDNDAAPGVTLGLSGSPLAEAAGSATVTATVAPVSGQDVTVTLGFTGTATLTGDYTRSAGSIVIPAGETSATMTLDAVDDLRDENDETVIVDVTAVTNGTETGTAQVTAQITDDDATPSVQFSAITTNAAENAGTVQVQVQLSAVSGREVLVSFGVAGSAGGSDFTLDTDPGTAGNQGSPVRIVADGTGSASIAVAITNDALDEPAETVELTLTGATDASLGTNTLHTLTIEDNDATPSVSFNPATAAVTETNSGVTNIVATAQLSAVSGQDVTVPFTVGGSAANPQDHDAVAGTITVPAGASSGTTSFNVANDLLDDSDTETVVLTMGTPTNATVGTGTHTTSITDNDAAPSMSFTASSQSAAEDVAGGIATVTVQLSGASGRAVSVPYALSGSATSGSDYSIPASPATIPAGTTQLQLQVGIINDANDEDDETAVVTLSAPANGSATLGATSVHTLTIIDNDDLPQLSFASATQNVIENVMLGTATITLQLSRAYSEDVTLPYSVVMISTATAGDYTIVSDNPFIIPAGSTSADIVVTINDDTSDEANETIIVALGTPTNATLVAPSSHTLTILDNDATPTVTLGASGSPMAEAGGVATVTAQLSAASGRDVTVNLGFPTTPAQNGVDYTRSATSIVIPAGNTSGSITVTAIQDALDESNEWVNVSISSAVNATRGTPNFVTIVITDDDPAPVVTLSLSGSPVAENGGVATVTAQLSAVSGRDVTVNLGFPATPAQNGVDYTRSAVSIVIPAGSTSGSITVTAIQDALDESNEWANVSISTVVNATKGTPNFVTVVITDDDPSPAVTLSLSGSPLAENGGVASVTATLSAVSGRSVTVNLGFSGTATSATDYTASSSIITIPAGSLSASMQLTGVDDLAVEAVETVVVDVVSTVNSVEATQQQVTATIQDND